MGIVEYSVVVASLVGLVVLRLYHEPSPELRRQLAVENGEQAGESGEDNYDGVISRPTARLMAGVESELPRVSWPIVAVALVAYFTIVAAAVAKHPWIGMGCLSFCALTACVHRYIVPKAPKVEDAFRAEQGR